jgi:hypothetical protein
MREDLIAAAGIPYESTSEVQRQALAAFAFGMVIAVGEIERLTPPEVHALCITLLIDGFEFSPERAGAFTGAMIEAAGEGGSPAIRAILRRGIDGYLQWSSGQTAELGESIGAVLQGVDTAQR